MSVELRSNPNWDNAAIQLLEACSALPDVDQRVSLIEKVALALSDKLYPAFIQILCVVNSSQKQSAKILITEAFIQALRSGRLPTGKLSAWGVKSTPHSSFGQLRSLGPIEYLCVWFSQPSGREPLTETAFRAAMQQLMSLIELTPLAKELYLTKLMADMSDPLGGALSGATQAAISELVAQWRCKSEIHYCINAFLNTLAQAGRQRLDSSNVLSSGFIHSIDSD